MSVISTHLLTIGYSQRGVQNIVQSNLNLQLHAGEMVCLIGPNGCGKSTLLRTIAGVQKALGGNIYINDKDIDKLSQKEKALLIALVLTDRVEIENTTVYQIVSLGRYPHNNWWGSIDTSDESQIFEAIQMVHLEHKTNCFYNELSDGEKQRVLIAKALAQDTSIIILDEPTAHLDLPNRVEIMLLLHKLAHKTQKAIVISTHELDLALQAADRIWLMSKAHGLEHGVPEDLVFNGSFNRAFQSNSYVFNASNGNFSMNYPMQKKVAVSGDKTRMYWTFRALARAGFMVVENANVHILITSEGWVMNDERFYSIETLLQSLNNINHSNF